MRQFIILFLLFSFTTGTFSQITFIAHRGASFIAPENTLAAVNLAWELDASHVEVDVFLTKDNQIMVCHDDLTTRTSGSEMIISQTDSEILRTLDVGSWKSVDYKGEKMPFLSEVFKTIPQNGILVVEIKCGAEILPAMKKLMESCDKKNQIVFISFGWETIVETKKLFPDNLCYWLSETKEGLEDKIRIAKNNNLDGINLDHVLIDERLMELAGQNKLEVLCWTVDDPEEAKRLIKLGVKTITTNRPGWLKEQLKDFNRTMIQ